MTIQTKDGLTIELEEYDIRRWFIAVPLEEASDTFKVLEGILEARTLAQPTRKRRRDAGTTRTQQTIDLREPAKDERPTE
jgi:hypothetical protein